MVSSIAPHRDELGLGDGLMLIDGGWVAAAGEESWSHRHPATGEQVASFPVAGPADVDLAVRAARQAFDDGPWPRARAGERARVLRKIASRRSIGTGRSTSCVAWRRRARKIASLSTLGTTITSFST
jgi:hypothetical protein